MALMIVITKPTNASPEGYVSRVTGYSLDL